MENVKKKEAIKEEHKKKSLEGMKKKKDDKVEIVKEKSEPQISPDVEDENVNEDDDAEWYRKEVGKEPEPGIYNFIFNYSSIFLCD